MVAPLRFLPRLLLKTLFISEILMLRVFLITDSSSTRANCIEEVIKANPGLTLVGKMIYEHNEGQHWRDPPFDRIKELASDILWTDLDGACTGCGLSTLRIARFDKFKQWSSYCGSDAGTLRFAIAMGSECLDSSTPESLQSAVAGALQKCQR
jgi:hypothetical protein